MKLRYLLVFVALIGCGTTAGVREFQSYARAFAAVEAASDVVLAKIAAAERAQSVALIDELSPDGISGRLPRENIVIFAPSADTPYVASVRYAIRSVLQFNDVMLAYAEGRAVGVLKGQIRDIQAAGIGFIAPEAAQQTALSAALPALNTALEALAGAGSREAFRAEMRDSADELDTVLEGILNSSETAFATLAGPDFTALRAIRSQSSKPAEAIRVRIAKKRELLAEWLHLVQLSRAALADAVASIDAPQSGSAQLVEAAVIAGDIMARADMVRRLAGEI